MTTWPGLRIHLQHERRPHSRVHHSHRLIYFREAEAGRPLRRVGAAGAVGGGDACGVQITALSPRNLH